MHDDEVRPESHAHALLRSGVPLSLLCDLAIPVPARDLLAAEPADVQWLAELTG